MSDGYECGTPDDHVFVPVTAQTGCARCGYARGHHPTAATLRQQRGPRCDETILVDGHGRHVTCDRHHGHDGACMACSDLIAK